MNNEPVVPFGWFWFESEENKSPYTQITGYTYERFSTMKPDGSAKIDEGTLMPLYTHPAKLTDEDLMEIFYEMTALSKLHCEALTKAILKRAQEK